MGTQTSPPATLEVQEAAVTPTHLLLAFNPFDQYRPGDRMPPEACPFGIHNMSVISSFLSGSFPEGTQRVCFGNKLTFPVPKPIVFRVISAKTDPDSLLPEVPSALRIMPDPFVAHVQACANDNLPQNNTDNKIKGKTFNPQDDQIEIETLSRHIFENNDCFVTEADLPLAREFQSVLGEETNPHLATTSLQGVVESDEVSPGPPLLQAKHPQLPQLLLVRPVAPDSSPAPLPFSGHAPAPRCLSWSEGTGLGTRGAASPVRVQGDNHCPGPAGHTDPDPGQEAIGVLGPLGTLLARVQQLSTSTPRSFSTGQLSSHSVPSL
ncbi:hypothetical protein BTVI_98768 [Pitangus sulphuratus]|nr:hypothetical protein BTVI_98768 [Pitangus sulphuratus]